MIPSLRNYVFPALALLFLLHGMFSLSSAVGQSSRSKSQESLAAHYKKWLDEDVQYIISDEERSVFSKLSNDQEKEQFIEQFWYRRDPDPRTPVNESKVEHYRRIAYANERFQSGKPGWMTDRGRIYIIHGEPGYIEQHPSGGHYDRPFKEGGGSTSTYPFEVWHYRYIEGIGEDVSLEFVDPSWSGEYRLALRPEEKDMFLRVPTMGNTVMEILGRSRRVDRPFFTPAKDTDSETIFRQGLTARDAPFARYSTYALSQRPPAIKFKDLQELVKVNVTYNALPFDVRTDYIRINESQALVPITVEVPNSGLSFKERDGIYKGVISVYGIVTSFSNRIIAEFEQSLESSYKPEQFEVGKHNRSAYQKLVMLATGQRYRLDLVVKDMNSGNVGVFRRAIDAPKLTGDRLAGSSLILSTGVEPTPYNPDDMQMFVIGDLKVRPNVNNVFLTKQQLGFYMQVYNFSVDQSTLLPSLRVTYEIKDHKATHLYAQDDTRDSVQFYSGQRVVLVKNVPLRSLVPGEYTAGVTVKDVISGQSITRSEHFKLLPSKSVENAGTAHQPRN